MSSFSRLRENLKIALMTTAIAAVTSVSFVEADDKAPAVDARAEMSERMNDLLRLSGYDADAIPGDSDDTGTLHHAPSKMSMKMQMMDLMLLAPDTAGTLKAPGSTTALRSLQTVESAYEALQEADKALKASTINMIVSEGYALDNPPGSHQQDILDQHQKEYLAARELAEQMRDHFVEEAHRARDKGIDIGKYGDMLSRTKARDYHLISLQDVETAEQKLANEIRTCMRTSSRRWSCD